MVGGRALSPEDRRRVAQALWGTVPPAAGTEIGAVAVMALGVIPGLIAALAALVALVLVLPRVRPTEGMVRGALLVTGPPVRYGLVLVMVWFVWVVEGEGAFFPVLAGLALVLVVPIAATGLGRLLYGRRAVGGRD